MSNLFESEQIPELMVEEEIPEITPEGIYNSILETDENGYTPCTIVAMIEEISNAENIDNIEEIKEDDREIIESQTIDFCGVDMYTLDGEILNIILTFDSPKDAYLRDLKQMLDRYKNMASRFVEEENGSELPMFSLTFMPNIYGGRGLGYFAFPISYFKTINEKNEQTSIHLLFNLENVSFEKITLSEDEISEITASLMREEEAKKNYD